MRIKTMVLDNSYRKRGFLEDICQYKNADEAIYLLPTYRYLKQDICTKLDLT